MNVGLFFTMLALLRFLSSGVVHICGSLVANARLHMQPWMMRVTGIVEEIRKCSTRARMRFQMSDRIATEADSQV